MRLPQSSPMAAVRPFETPKNADIYRPQWTLARTPWEPGGNRERRTKNATCPVERNSGMACYCSKADVRLIELGLQPSAVVPIIGETRRPRFPNCHLMVRVPGYAVDRKRGRNLLEIPNIIDFLGEHLTPEVFVGPILSV